MMSACVFSCNTHIPMDSGWSRSYNFGSLAAAQERWRAAQKTGVDYIASDQYELLAVFFAARPAVHLRSGLCDL